MSLDPNYRRVFMPKQPRCPCGASFAFNRYCGAEVCDGCDRHRGMDRCFCGWSADGGDGRAQLEEMGEVIDPEP